VTRKNSEESEFGDIAFEASVTQMMYQAMGGLNPENVILVTKDWEEAKKVAEYELKHGTVPLGTPRREGLGISDKELANKLVALAENILKEDSRFGSGGSRFGDYLDWERKPDSWGEVPLYDGGNLPTAEIDKLPHYDMEEVYGNLKDATPYDSFQKAMPQYFTLSTYSGVFLVNTEGYDYARYIIKLAG
jgi:hypothetical protein